MTPSAHQREEREETAKVDFKSSFEPKYEWCELIKDIVAMANSGGGEIIIGLEDNGDPSGHDILTILSVDLADVVNKIRSYTDVNFSGVSIVEETVNSASVALVVVRGAPTPLVFSKPGNFVDSQNRQHCAFRPGAIYVRHGPKSEPATSDDLRTIIEANVAKERASLLKNLRQVIEAPIGSTISIGGPNIPLPAEVIVVDESNGKTLPVLDPNKTHPYRQKEVVQEVNKRQEKYRFTSNDNVALRRLHNVDQQKRFAYKPAFGSTQYSPAYINWVQQQLLSSPDFLQQLRSAYHNFVVNRNADRKKRLESISSQTPSVLA